MSVKACSVICFVASVVGLATPLRADDQPFLTIYTTDIDGQREREAEQWLGWKTGQTGASYDDLLSRTEVEYGITDDLQGSLYVNYEWARLQARTPPLSSDTESLAGVSGELIYRILNADFAPIGLALYVEPGWSSDEQEVESKILLQKNFLNDTLRCAFNVNFEDDWELDHSESARHGALEFDTGASYAVTPEVSAGVEFDNERAFAGLVMGSGARETASAYFLGPTLEYSALPWKLAVGAQAQLPWATSPAGNAGAVIGGFETRAERFRIALRVSRDF